MDQFEEPGKILPSQSSLSDTDTVQSADQAIRSADQQAPIKELAVGAVVEGRYKILSVIGRGAVGCVYRVEKTSLNQQFALKTLLSAVNTDVARQRFQKEARAAGRLEHPNVVRAVDFGIMEDNQLFIVMDLVEGQTLAEHLKSQGRMTVETALQIFIPICHGLAHAHNGGVVHRDIKPGNIVLVPSGTGETKFVPKIVDFGIAKVEVGNVRDEQALTKIGEIFGTPLYMSPEQCAGLPVDQRSDIYSLGCVIFESLTGAPPLKGESALATMIKHQNERPLSLKEASNGLAFPPGLEAVVAKMLAKEPDDRYSSCLRLAEDLIILQRGGEITASDLPPSKSEVASTRSSIPLSYAYYLLIPVFASVAIFAYMHAGSHRQPKPLPVNSGTAKTRESEPNQVRAAFCTRDRRQTRMFDFGNSQADPTFTYGSEITYFQPVGIDNEKNKKQQPAKGKILVPPGYCVEFEPSPAFIVEHSSLWHCFRPGDIQRLRFDFKVELAKDAYVDSVSFDHAISNVADLQGLDKLTFMHVPLDVNGLEKMKLDSMHDLTSLSLLDTNVDGNDLSRFTILGQLNALEFSYGKNSAALIKTLRGLWHHSAKENAAKDRRYLILRNDDLTDDDLSILGECDCWFLQIPGNPALTNAGLKQLIKQQKLYFLGLDGEQFDRSTLRDLALKLKLDVLGLGHVSWTEGEKEQLCRSLPKCQVVFDNPGVSEPVPDQIIDPHLEPGASDAIEKNLKKGEDSEQDRVISQKAALLFDQGKYEEAKLLYGQQLAIRERVLGKNDKDLADTLDRLARCYKHQEKYKEAEPLLERALKINRNALGPDGPDLANSLFYLAECYVRQLPKRYKEALPLFERALAIADKAFGQNHPDVVQFIYALADCYSHLGQYKEAEPLLKRALDICDKAQGKDKPDVVESLTKMAECYDGLGKYQEEELLLKRALTVIEKRPRQDHAVLAETLDAQVNCYEHLGNHSEAEKARTRARAIRSQ